MVVDKVLRFISDASVAGAAVYPSSPYTGALPKGVVKKGTKGADALAVQQFLNWCIKAGLVKDAVIGPKSVAAIKKYQKQYRLKVDGIFGAKSKAKSKQIIAKYAPKPKPSPTPQPDTSTWVDRANAWAKMIAADNSFHYMKWVAKDSNTHTCPICSKRVTLNTVWDSVKHAFTVLLKKINCKSKYVGWNCIGLSWAIWHHGGGIPCKCNCHVISNGIGEQIYKASAEKALKLVQEHSGLKAVKVIRNKNGIPKDQWKPGDICLQFKGSKYVHSFYYMGNGKICDAAGSSGKVPNDKQIAVRSYKNYSAKIIIRYTGK